MTLKVDFIDNSDSQYDGSACEIDLPKSKVRGRLFVGDINAASFLQLKHRNVTSVVTCAMDLFGYCKESDIKYCKVDPDDKLIGFENATKFIDEELESGKNVLVHCSNGEGKSAAVVIYYMMKKHKKTAASTIRHLRRHGREVKPRVTAVEYLIACEKKLFGHSTIELGGRGNREIVCVDEGSTWGSHDGAGGGSATKKRRNGPPLNACLILLALVVGLFGILYAVTGKL